MSGDGKTARRQDGETASTYGALAGDGRRFLTDRSITRSSGD
jgi:hypothetical protein